MSYKEKLRSIKAEKDTQESVRLGDIEQAKKVSERYFLPPFQEANTILFKNRGKIILRYTQVGDRYIQGKLPRYAVSLVWDEGPGEMWPWVYRGKEIGVAFTPGNSQAIVFSHFDEPIDINLDDDKAKDQIGEAIVRLLENEEKCVWRCIERSNVFSPVPPDHSSLGIIYYDD